jgi:4-alpha-glucanotransferase
MGDDGEKFGAWPTTWEHCWGEGRWVEDFFEALEANAAWLATVRPSDWLASHPPVGRAYVPTGSYVEMGEWSLPPDEGRAFASALHHARETGALEARWLRGGFWRNFQVKYREINDLHKQMLRTSAKVAALAPGEAREAALDHLYRGQSNDCYWHGLFGGIYIAHMRAATFEHLIAAEDLADAAGGTSEAAETADLDLDGRDEVRLATAGQVVVVKLDEGAGIGSWDLRAARHALAAVLRRRPEAYHETLRAYEAKASMSHAAEGDGGAADGNAANGGAPASIHDIVKPKEVGLAAHLRYDGYERRSGLLRAMPLEATAADWAAGGGDDLGDPAMPLRVESLEAGRLVTIGSGWIAGVPVEVRRELELGGGRLDPSLRLAVSVRNSSADARLEARLGLEWAVTMLGGGGNPAAWWEVEGRRSRHDGSGVAAGAETVAQGNDWLGVALATTANPTADAWWAPIETVSNSEDGFERVYQGSTLLLSWTVDLGPGASWTAAVQHRATIAAAR